MESRSATPILRECVMEHLVPGPIKPMSFAGFGKNTE